MGDGTRAVHGLVDPRAAVDGVDGLDGLWVGWVISGDGNTHHSKKEES